METRNAAEGPGPIEWIEITADYRCNNRCLGCFAVDDEGPSMDRQELMRALRLGRELGARSLWLGGGEPTLRTDLFAAVRAARRLGYTRVKLQTNGMLLSYPDFSSRLADAGVTEISFGIRGAGTATHDRLTATPGCHDLMLRGIEQARRIGLTAQADLLVYKENLPELVSMVRRHFAAGIDRFDIWLFSNAGASDDSLVEQVPRISHVVPRIMEAMDLGLSDRPDFIVSLHTPPCTVPESHHRCLFHAAALGLLVVNPGGHAFRLETSPIEGGLYLDRCRDCSFRARCGGAREDYVRIHGDGELKGR